MTTAEELIYIRDIHVRAIRSLEQKIIQEDPEYRSLVILDPSAPGPEEAES